MSSSPEKNTLWSIAVIALEAMNVTAAWHTKLTCPISLQELDLRILIPSQSSRIAAIEQSSMLDGVSRPRPTMLCLI